MAIDEKPPDWEIFEVPCCNCGEMQTCLKVDVKETGVICEKCWDEMWGKKNAK